jgi:hypothetical protein
VRTDGAAGGSRNAPLPPVPTASSPADCSPADFGAAARASSTPRFPFAGQGQARQ